MLIRKADRKVEFDEINKIYFDNGKIVHSNHPRYKPGQRVDEAIRFGHVAAKGWEAIPLNHYNLQTEALSVEDLINNVILADSESFRWTVFDSQDGESVIFAQTRKGKVAAMDENGDEKLFDSVEEFLKSLPEGFVLAGVVDEDEIELEV